MEVNPCAIVKVFHFEEELDNVCATYMAIIIRYFYLLQKLKRQQLESFICHLCFKIELARH